MSRKVLHASPASETSKSFRTASEAPVYTEVCQSTEAKRGLSDFLWSRGNSAVQAFFPWPAQAGSLTGDLVGPGPATQSLPF